MRTISPRHWSTLIVRVNCCALTGCARRIFYSAIVTRGIDRWAVRGLCCCNGPSGHRRSPGLCYPCTVQLVGVHDPAGQTASTAGAVQRKRSCSISAAGSDATGARAGLRWSGRPSGCQDAAGPRVERRTGTEICRLDQLPDRRTRNSKRSERSFVRHRSATVSWHQTIHSSFVLAVLCVRL